MSDLNYLLFELLTETVTDNAMISVFCLEIRSLSNGDVDNATNQ